MTARLIHAATGRAIPVPAAGLPQDGDAATAGRRRRRPSEAARPGDAFPLWERIAESTPTTTTPTPPKI